MSLDYYQILGLQKGCAQEEIEKAYKKLALRYHPDRNPGDNDAANKFLEVQKAYDTLKDPQKRHSYDNPAHNFNFPFGNPFNVTNDIFEQENLDIRILCHVSLAEAVKGAVKDINFSRKSSCQDCKGSGHGNFKACSVCQGHGVVINAVNNFFKFQTLCGNCLGRGKIGTSKCATCNGSKNSSPEEISVKLQVPQGIQHGMTLCVHNQGNIGTDGRLGHVYVEIHLQENPNYKLNGLDITTVFHAPISTLVFGGQIEIPTFDDDLIVIDVPAGTKCATKFRIKEKGLPDFRNIQKRGDLIANVLVDVPPVADVNLKNLLLSYGL